VTVGSHADRQYRSRSLWLDQLDEVLDARPMLPGDVDADVAVVGAGMTGLWTAYYLARAQPDLSIVVVEREIAGFGASGRNGGWAGGGLAGSAGRYARRHGWDAVRRALRATNDAVDEMGRMIEAEQVDCGYRKGGTLEVAMTDPQRRRLESAFEAYQSRGMLSDGDRMLDLDEAAGLARIPGMVGAFYTPYCARIDPARLTRGLARSCQRLGVRIYEGTEVVRIATGRAQTRGGTVRAPIVLRATESYTTQLPGQRLRYLPLSSLMIATEPLSDPVWDEIGWPHGLTIRDRRHLFFYAQRTVDNRIAIGGRGAPYRLRHPLDERNERNQAVRDRLVETLRTHFPAAADAAITHHWGGTLAVPRDWSMAIHFDRTTGLGWAGGYSGHGVGAAALSGRTLADLALGRETELTTLPWVGHRTRRWEPEPARYLASRAIVNVLRSSDEYEDRTDRTARRARLLRGVLPPE
jgi:glycine/D-amino acid oxidase-like deaminating enzyme